MNILFLTIDRIDSIEESNIYTDLLREFSHHGHNIYLVSAIERKHNTASKYSHFANVYQLQVKIGNITQCGVIEKGISTILIEKQFIRAIKKYVSAKIDLVMCPTPPVTFAKVVEFIKKRDKAQSYLLLKDIFPQNAVDLGMMSTTGLKSLLYKYFRKKEKKLYALSDRIGCMSQANVDYVIQHNSEVDPSKVEICPNCIEVQDLMMSETERVEMRNKYSIPQDKTVFVYGGNLGKPQGIPFIIECLKKLNGHPDAYFLIVGDGTEFSKLKAFFDEWKPENMKLLQRLPKDDYDHMVAACDVGMIFLDHRFTIPNFPSRLLAYMQAGLPILACTDSNTDVGKVIVDGGFGWWCESCDSDGFDTAVGVACHADTNAMGSRARSFLNNQYNVSSGYQIIMNFLEK